jgi:hypothetical protein
MAGGLPVGMLGVGLLVGAIVGISRQATVKIDWATEVGTGPCELVPVSALPQKRRAATGMLFISGPTILGPCLP